MPFGVHRNAYSAFEPFEAGPTLKPPPTMTEPSVLAACASLEGGAWGSLIGRNPSPWRDPLGDCARAPQAHEAAAAASATVRRRDRRLIME
jgi:hypothetical protein